MAYRDLHEFLDVLERAGELHRVRVEVDPELEIAEITARMSKMPGGGKALLFEKVKGSSFPVVTNIFGSCERMSVALDVTRLNDLTGRMEELFTLAMPTPDQGSKPAFPGVEMLSRYSPVVVDQGRCQEVVESLPNLLQYPFLKCWPGDGVPDRKGRFITLPQVFTKDPDTGRSNCGMYRIQVFDVGTAGIHWYAGRGGECHYRKYQERRERMPIAVAVGGAPAVTFAATLPLPEEVDELQFAGFLRRAPVEMVRCRTSELLVPASAELVIEGYLEPGETTLDGAFGNHTGFYSPPAIVPLLKVSCITRRENPVYMATVVGRPPMEDCYLAKAGERLFLPLFKRMWPEIVDINFPMEWIFHKSAIVSVREPAPEKVREIVRSMWRSASMGSARMIVVVDADTDVQDLSCVAWRIMNTVDWRKDLIVSDSSEKVAAFPWLGSGIGVDATRKKGTVSWPDELRMDAGVSRLVDERWMEYGF